MKDKVINNTSVQVMKFPRHDIEFFCAKQPNDFIILDGWNVNDILYERLE